MRHPTQKAPPPTRDKPPAPISDAVAHELDQWAQWQHDLRGVSIGCIRYRREWITPLLNSMPVINGNLCWTSCDVALLNDFVVRRSKGLSPASGAAIVDATRSLMRWALVSGRIDRDLTGGILRARHSREILPQALTPQQLTALMATCDTANASGIRDRAVITTLSRLGLRAGELAALRLDDINWATGQLTVIGKGQRRLNLPIPVDVGDALVAWLHVRPTTTDRGLFVRLRRPHTALTPAGISDIVAHRGSTAGLGVIHAHRLRHTAATAVIATGGSITEAGELLGHATATTTRIYARTDLTSLRTLATEFGAWPT